MSVSDAVGRFLDGDEGPLAAVARRLAGQLDDPAVSARDAASVSRELRQVLAEVDVDGEPVDGEVFDLEARRKAREQRRTS